MWQYAAFILIGIGLLALIGWAVQGFFTADDIPVLIRIAVGVMGLGVLILLGVAIKERIIRAKDDDFKGVDN
jgi:hypothetical protein